MLNTSKVSKQNRPWFSFIKITNSKFDEFYSSHYRYEMGVKMHYFLSV